MNTYTLWILLSALIGSHTILDTASPPSGSKLVYHMKGQYRIEIDRERIDASTSYYISHIADLNNKLCACITKNIQDFKEMHYAYDYITQSMPESRLFIEIIPTRYKELLNFEIRIYQSIRGAAHGNGLIKTITCCLKTEKIMRLSDLFEDSESYLNKLCEKSRAALKRLFLTIPIEFDERTERGIEPIEDNYAAWIMKDSGLEIIFNAYQVTAGCYGEQRILIEIEEGFNMNPSSYN